jgi:heptosyltransferase-1
LNIEFRLDAKGIGDAICGVYTACGLADRGHLVTFHAKHTAWLKWFKHPNLTIVPEKDPQVFNANAGYPEQLEASRTGTCESRSLWYMQNLHTLHPVIKGKPQPARPLEYEKLGTCSDLPTDYIVLAPFSAYEDRQWDIHHWRMLAKLLMNEGHTVIAIGSPTDGDRLTEAFTKSGVRYFWGQSPEWVVNAICNAKILIGNDSGPAHVAGLYGSKAIALCGQIDGNFVFRHSPTVKPVMPPEQIPCRMCHWTPQGGFTSVCDRKCSALQLISPFEVADQAIKDINESIERKAGERKADVPGQGVPGIQQTSKRTKGQPKEKDGAGKEG